MTFAEQVLFVRKKLYLSRSDMAKEIGVTEQTIYRWEQGLSKLICFVILSLLSECRNLQNIDNNY